MIECINKGTNKYLLVSSRYQAHASIDFGVYRSVTCLFLCLGLVVNISKLSLNIEYTLLSNDCPGLHSAHMSRASLLFSVDLGSVR